jgi:hypothetical protein
VLRKADSSRRWIAHPLISKSTTSELHQRVVLRELFNSGNIYLNRGCYMSSLPRIPATIDLARAKMAGPSCYHIDRRMRPYALVFPGAKVETLAHAHDAFVLACPAEACG